MRTPELEARLRLANVSGLGPRLTQRLEEAFGDPLAVVDASVASLKRVEGIGPKRAADVRRSLDELDVEEQWRLIESHGVRLIALGDPAYPPLLRHIHDPPPLLFVKGTLERVDSVALAMVGSRKCTGYGREQAERLGASCASAGLTIVSGGARGIDSAAHRGALRVKGRSIAVTGCGLGHCYPPENAELFEAIAGSGAVLSELPMTAPPVAENFPRRNRIISGLSLGVLVVEAAVRSGALITARLAAEEHHREVMALPGRVDSNASAGCHKIIREGWASLVTNTADILDALGETGRILRSAADEAAAERRDEPETPTLDTAGLNDEQRRLFQAIGPDPTEIDAIVRETGIPIAAAQGHLTLFQLRGMVERVGGNRVRRRR